MFLKLILMTHPKNFNKIVYHTALFSKGISRQTEINETVRSNKPVLLVIIYNPDSFEFTTVRINPTNPLALSLPTVLVFLTSN